MKSSLFLILLGSISISGAALAQTEVEQTTTVEHGHSDVGADAGAGAIAGAVVGGPVGAAVGAGAGAIVGAVTSPPTVVHTYVTEQNVQPAQYDGDIEVGRPIHGDIRWMDIPDQPRYRWAYLGEKRVVIDSETDQVVAVY